jgi:hypothetical protein
MNTLDLGPCVESDSFRRPGGGFGGSGTLILKATFKALPFVKKGKTINLN